MERGKEYGIATNDIRGKITVLLEREMKVEKAHIETATYRGGGKDMVGSEVSVY